MPVKGFFRTCVTQYLHQPWNCPSRHHDILLVAVSSSASILISAIPRHQPPTEEFEISSQLIGGNKTLLHLHLHHLIITLLFHPLPSPSLLYYSFFHFRTYLPIYRSFASLFLSLTPLSPPDYLRLVLHETSIQSDPILSNRSQSNRIDHSSIQSTPIQSNCTQLVQPMNSLTYIYMTIRPLLSYPPLLYRHSNKL